MLDVLVQMCKNYSFSGVDTYQQVKKDSESDLVILTGCRGSMSASLCGHPSKTMAAGFFLCVG